MPKGGTNNLIQAGMATSTVVQDSKQFMRADTRLKMRDCAVVHKINNGPPEFLKYNKDVFYVVEVQYCTKDNKEAAYAYFGYLPVI